MTENPKPGELPTPIDQIDPSVRELIIDQHLSRVHLISRIRANLAEQGLDTRDEETGHLTYGELADIYQFLTDDLLPAKWDKTDIAEAIALHYGVDFEPTKSGFAKTSLVRVLVAQETADEDATDPNTVSGLMTGRDRYTLQAIGGDD